MKLRLFSFLLCIVSLSNSYAQFDSDGIVSPLAGGSNSGRVSDAPWASLNNPAANALIQRLTLDIMYGLLTDDRSTSDFGHLLGLGVAIPSNLGTFSANLGYQTSNLNALPIGNMGLIELNFAKDLYPDLFFGIGIRSEFGETQSKTTDWGLSASLGFIHKPSDFLKDFTWGVAFKGLGKGYTSSQTIYPSIFTPSIGASFTVFEQEFLSLALGTDLSFPGFQNLVWQSGLRIGFVKSVYLDVGYDFDLQKVSRGTSMGLSLGLSFRIGGDSTNKDSNEADLPFFKSSEFLPSVYARALDNHTWNIGTGLTLPLGVLDSKAPVASFSQPETSFISPNLDGKQDNLSFALDLTDERYITSFTLTIFDKDKLAVRTIKNKDQRPEADTIDSLFQRFVRVKKGVPIPDPLVWDGLDNNGKAVVDGTYSWVIEATDDNGNTYTSPPYITLVDTQAPTLVLSAPKDNQELAFSPKGDRSVLKLDMASSPETTWKSEVFDARGTLIVSQSFEKDLPKAFTWDGRDQNGGQASDGIYAIKLSSTDLAGNYAETNINNVLLISEPTPLGLTPDTKHFSPNDDQVKDEIHIVVNANQNVKTISYSVSLMNSKNEEVYAKTDSGALPELISLVDPLAKSKSNQKPHELVIPIRKDSKIYAEDSYVLKLSAIYINGNRPVAIAQDLVLDITPPKASAKANLTSFSPNGDGKKDSITFQNTTSEEPEWNAIIWNPDGKELTSFNWNNLAPNSLEWNGGIPNDTVAPDGKNYKYQLVATDLAGNRGQSAPISFDIDKRPGIANIQSLLEAISPNNDKVQDEQTFAMTAQPADGIESWTLSISKFDSISKPIFEVKGSGSLPPNFQWKGVQTSGLGAGTAAPEGLYRARLEVLWLKGDSQTSVSRDFDLDVSPPVVKLKSGIPGLSFSPDSDGKLDTLPIEQTDSSSENLWTGLIKKSDGGLVRTLTWTGHPQNFEWEGKDSGNQRVLDGSYTYEISATDKAGNRTRVSLGPIKVDTLKRELSLDPLAKAFSPNGDGKKDAIGFKPSVNKTDGIKSYNLEILTTQANDSQIVASKSGKNPMTETLSWDGLGGGKKSPEGEYVARLTVIYESGQTPQTTSSKFQLVTTIPTAKAFATLGTISPDGDGQKDRTPITQSADPGKLPITWIAQVIDANQKPIKTWSWVNSISPSVDWDGTDNNGKVVPDGEYNYVINGQDEADNQSKSQAISIRVDTRAIKLGIKPRSQAFSPNGDSIQDQITLGTVSDLSDGIDNWTVQYLNTDSGITVRTSTFKGKIPDSTIWDGKSDDGKVSPDGAYQAIFVVRYLKGNQPSSKSEIFYLDTKAPSAKLTPKSLLFSPDGDGFVDEAKIDQESSVEDLWTGTIFDKSNQPISSFTWRGKTPSVAWNGKTQAGIEAPDGDYYYSLSSKDAAGNNFSTRLNGVKVDRRHTAVRLSANQKGLNPLASEKTVSTINLLTYLDLEEGIDTWSLTINTQAGSPIRTINGMSNVPEAISWDGTLNPNAQGQKGPQAPDGKYIGIIEVQYLKGNRALAQSPVFDLDTQGPISSIKPNPKPFSPDDDGIDDDVIIGLNIKDQSEIRDWKLEIFDPENHAFTEWSGRGHPTDKLTWNGRDKRGELVQAAEDYTAKITVSDIYGNTSSVSAAIPVDVLVIRDGDLLRIRLPGIEFPSGSDDLKGVDSEKQQKNIRTLDRLSEILRKYNAYKIVVEGHANSTNVKGGLVPDANEQKTELLPLSAKRAQAVRLALIERGIGAQRLDSVGVGGSRPIIDFGDADNRWKNRRVEFILKK